MAITLAFENGSEAAPMTMSGAVITIGRVAGNDIVLADPRISSRHGRLLRQGEGYIYEDLGSRNGSMLERNGEKNVIPSHEPIEITQGDRLLLGDLVTPVVVVIRRVPRSFMEYDGGTVVAHRSAIMTDRTLTQHEDSQIIRDLFDLLHGISGQTDPKTVLAQIGSAVLKRFSYANCLSVLLRDGDGEWVAQP